MLSGNWPRVSVIVPCREEERYIARCLDGILATDYPADRLEVIVAEGRSEDRTREIVQSYADRDARVRLLDNPRRIKPTALNLAIQAASGEIIVRMDAHSIFPAHYIPELVKALEETGADIVGGAIDTQPGDDSTIAEAIAIATRHPFGIGNSPFRVATRKRCWVDHVPFFCCRRSLFDRVGFFDEELICNQDGEFSARVIRKGGRILLVPEARAQYFARPSLAKLMRMFYQYGYYKVLTAVKVRRIMTMRQLAPPAFLLTLASSAAAAPWFDTGAVALGSVSGAYAAVVCATAVAAARGRIGHAGVLMVAFPLMHFSYGFGQLRRIAELAAGIRFHRTDPALVPLSR